MQLTTRFVHINLDSLTHTISESNTEKLMKMNPLDRPPDLVLDIMNQAKTDTNHIVFVSMPGDEPDEWHGHLYVWNTRTGHRQYNTFGSPFAEAFHRAGFDYILISGKAKEPVYIYMSDMLLLFENPNIISGVEPAKAIDELLSKHEWINPQVILPDNEGSLNFGPGMLQVPGLGEDFRAKNLWAIVVDGTGLP
ncbi:MAG: hypothetical protein Kow00127_15590 [Bacteroidales bacterium]